MKNAAKARFVLSYFISQINLTVIDLCILLFIVFVSIFLRNIAVGFSQLKTGSPKNGFSRIKTMSWVRIWVHLVFSTKNRKAYLHQNIRKQIFQHIKQNAETKGIWLDCVNGYVDHAHCLVSLNKEQSISKVAQMIKGESSFWINKNKLVEGKFIWQDDYWAVGVSESHLAQTRKYIFNQEAHHRKTTFKKEVDEFMKKYGWEHIQE